MFEKLQGASSGTFKMQPKVKKFPDRKPSNFEVKSTPNLEPCQKLITPKAKHSSQNSIKTYFLGSNNTTNRNPDVMTTTNQKPSKVISKNIMKRSGKTSESGEAIS